MRTLKRQFPATQRGSFYTGLVMILVFGGLLTVALKMAPSYIDDRVLNSTMTEMEESGELKNLALGETRTKLKSSLDRNGIDNFDTRAVEQVKEGNLDFIEVKYETRVHLFWNIDAVMVFNHRYAKQ
jgi:NurA-like 5'-3' nuclease